jgi:Cys-tRNA(Pro)/Cys-tRNA(Cys) deacylase
MDFKNNVTRFLESKRVSYQLFIYDYAAGVQSAVEVAAAIGLPSPQVFKTLVTIADDAKRKPMLVIVPGPATLDLKIFAKATNQKKVKMATHEQAESLTGLQTGGISPLALINKGFDTYLDDRALQFDAIAVSAGERGANLLVPVKDLIKLTRARLVHLAEN